MSRQQSPNGEIFFVCVVYGQKKQAKGKEWENSKKKKKRSERPDQKSRSREVLRVINLSGVWVLGNLLFFFLDFPIFALRVGSHFLFLLL